MVRSDYRGHIWSYVWRASHPLVRKSVLDQMQVPTVTLDQWILHRYQHLQKKYLLWNQATTPKIRPVRIFTALVMGRRNLRQREAIYTDLDTGTFQPKRTNFPLAQSTISINNSLVGASNGQREWNDTTGTTARELLETFSTSWFRITTSGSTSNIDVVNGRLMIHESMSTKAGGNLIRVETSALIEKETRW